MTWSKAEARIIDGLSRTQSDVQECLHVIENALLGNLETRKPGMIDEVRKLKSDAKVNKKQHSTLFGLMGIFLIVVIFNTFSGNSVALIEWIVKLIK